MGRLGYSSQSQADLGIMMTILEDGKTGPREQAWNGERGGKEVRAEIETEDFS